MCIRDRHYIDMREVQFQMLKYMREHFSRISITVKQTELVANFTEEVASVIGKEVNVKMCIRDSLCICYRS